MIQFKRPERPPEFNVELVKKQTKPQSAAYSHMKQKIESGTLTFISDMEIDKVMNAIISSPVDTSTKLQDKILHILKMHSEEIYFGETDKPEI